MANKRFDQLTQKTTLHDEDYIAIADSEDLTGDNYPKSKYIKGSLIKNEPYEASIFFLSDYSSETNPLAYVNTRISSGSWDIVYLHIDADSSENVTFSSKITIVPAGGILSGTVVIDRVDQSCRIQIFNSSSDVTLNYNDYVLPEWWGAKPDNGVTNNTTSLNLITALMDVGKIPNTLFYGEGRYNFSTEPNQISVGNFNLIGAGVEHTNLDFVSDSDIIFIDIIPDAIIRERIIMRNFIITFGGSGNKTAIKLTEISRSHFENIEINIGGSTGNDIGLHLNKRDLSSFKEMFIYCVRPIYVTDTLDHFNFHNLILCTPSTTYPCIEFDTGGGMSNCSFTGHQSWNGGNGGLYLNNSSNVINTSFHNIRWESPNSIPHATANACIHLETTGYIRSVNFYNCYIAAVDTDDDSPSTCVYLREANNVNFYGCTFASPNNGCYWLDADNTCNDIYSKSIIYQGVGEANLGSDLVFVSGVAANNVYPVSGQQEIHIMNHGSSFNRETAYSYLSGAKVAHYNVELADGAELDLIGHTSETYRPYAFNPTMTQYVVSFDSGTGSPGGGQFLISADTADWTADKISGSSNIVGSNTPSAGQMGIYKSNAVYKVRLKNNTGESRRVQVIAYMS